MNLNNKYFVRGLLFILIGFIFILWSFDIIRINIFGIFNFALAVVLIFYGEKYIRFIDTRPIGRPMILLGIVLMIYNFGVSIKFILAIVFLGLGIYFIFVKSKTFMIKKGVFKDSRSDVYVKEMFSVICINNVSTNLSSVKVRSYFSDITLDFLNSRLESVNSVDFELTAFLSNVKININSSWNVVLNGEYIRRIEGSYKVVNIRCSNLFSLVDIM